MYCVPRYSSCCLQIAALWLYDLLARGRGVAVWRCTEKLFLLLLLLLTSVIALSSRIGLSHLSCWLLIPPAWQKRAQPIQVFLVISVWLPWDTLRSIVLILHPPHSLRVFPLVHVQSSAAKCLFFLFKHALVAGIIQCKSRLMGWGTLTV